MSDIHLTAEDSHWRIDDWFSKRLAAWMNFRWLGRGRRFQHADHVLTRLMHDMQERGSDFTIFSGDATALGFEPEFRKAADLLQVQQRSGLGVPGNHDYCTTGAERSGLFEKYFAPWLEGIRVEGATYPFARKVGPAWLIGVNTATGNVWPWDAGGSAGRKQLDRLRKLFQQLDTGPRILVTHYPVCRSCGKPEHRVRGLRDLDDMVKVAAEGGVRVWLHGHRHGSYFLDKPPQAPFPVICAGSSTQSGHWSYGEYTLEDDRLEAVRRLYNPERNAFEERESFTIRFV